MKDKTCATPLTELLCRIPLDARLEWSEDEFSHSMAPVGRYCYEAAQRIEELEAAIRHFRDEYASGKYNAAAQELFKTLERE